MQLINSKWKEKNVRPMTLNQYCILLKQDFYLDSEDEVPDDDQSSHANILPSFHSQAVTALASYGSDPGHKESLLHDQVLSKLTSKVSTCPIVISL